MVVESVSTLKFYPEMGTFHKLFANFTNNDTGITIRALVLLHQGFFNTVFVVNMSTVQLSYQLVPQDFLFTDSAEWRLLHFPDFCFLLGTVRTVFFQQHQLFDTMVMVLMTTTKLSNKLIVENLVFTYAAILRWWIVIFQILELLLFFSLLFFFFFFLAVWTYFFLFQHKLFGAMVMEKMSTVKLSYILVFQKFFFTNQADCLFFCRLQLQLTFIISLGFLGIL